APCRPGCSGTWWATHSGSEVEGRTLRDRRPGPPFRLLVECWLLGRPRHLSGSFGPPLWPFPSEQSPHEATMRSFDLPGQDARPDALRFSPDSRYLAIQTCGQVDVLDTTTGATRRLCPESGTVGTAGVGFTADGRGLVYFKAADHSVRAFELHTG